MRFLGIEFKKVEDLNLAERIGKTAAKAVIAGSEIKTKAIELKNTGKEKATGLKTSIVDGYHTAKTAYQAESHKA